ncbi:MarR family winged helix-turn-helix transcriptional regulator [Nocardia sp. GTS18]|uniref:MarR family winged helix-turn-helix transcriptional regulator n=1 Tax=Nocardia sp. GTS18 TaxID=1778064 RepID=UPI0015EE474B|nr:MarR family transcriptional regulator [Nocardia sp. GTS18]
MDESTADAVDAIAAQWRRERPDLDLAAMAVFGRLGRLLNVATARIESVFTAHGLQRGEFDVLAALRRSGAPFELNPSVLADTLMLSRAGMTGRIDRLEAAGLVRRIADRVDRRAVRVALTEQGRELVDRVVVAHTENETAMLSVLDRDDQVALDRIARKLLGEWENGPDPAAGDGGTRSSR